MASYGKPEPSRNKGSLGNFKAIFRDPKQLLKPESYVRRLLTVVGGSSEQITDRFNERYGQFYKRKKTQGGLVNYLTVLQTYGLVEKTTIETTLVNWSVAQGVNVNDGQALYDRAKARCEELKRLYKIKAP